MILECANQVEKSEILLSWFKHFFGEKCASSCPMEFCVGGPQKLGEFECADRSENL